MRSTRFKIVKYFFVAKEKREEKKKKEEKKEKSVFVLLVRLISSEINYDRSLSIVAHSCWMKSNIYFSSLCLSQYRCDGVHLRNFSDEKLKVLKVYRQKHARTIACKGIRAAHYKRRLRVCHHLNVAAGGEIIA